MTSRIIAIAGAKGSPGCSFLAVALAQCLAAGNIPTLLLDADAEGGGIAAMLNRDADRPVRAFEHESFDEHAAQIDSCLWFAQVGQAVDEPANGLEVANVARARHQAVVVDLGHSAGPFQRQISVASDWLLWVVVPDRSGLDRADRALASGALDAANTGLVLNRITTGCLDRAGEVLSSRHGMRVLARINEDRRIADGLSRGRAVHEQRGLKRTLRMLARSIHPDLRSGVSSWS